MPIENNDVYREVMLHRTVLDKAVIDSFTTNKELRKEMDSWLKLDNQDFIESCERALLEPDKVFKTFQVLHALLKGDNAKFKGFRSDKPSHT